MPRSRDFAEARILRIYPPLTAALLVTIIVYLLISGFDLHGAESYRLGGELSVVREKATLEWSALPSTFLLLYSVVPYVPPPINMDGPLWTLSYEWWFYILTFLVARLWNGRTLSTVAPLLTVLAMLWIGRNTLFLWFLLIWLGGFGLGQAYLAGALRRDKFWHRVAMMTALTLVAILLLGRDHVLRDLLNPFDTPSAQKIMVCAGWLFTFAIAAVLHIGGRKQWRLPSAITGLSAFSYTLYVIHYPLLLLAWSLLHPFAHALDWPATMGIAAATLVPIIIASALLAKIVENRKVIRRYLAYAPQPSRAETDRDFAS